MCALLGELIAGFHAGYAKERPQDSRPDPRATTDLAKAYNKYYYEHRILDGEPGEIAARVQLTDAVRQVIKTGLYLIGMEAPERM